MNLLIVRCMNEKCKHFQGEYCSRVYLLIGYSGECLGFERTQSQDKEQKESENGKRK